MDSVYVILTIRSLYFSDIKHKYLSNTSNITSLPVLLEMTTFLGKIESYNLFMTV